MANTAFFFEFNIRKDIDDSVQNTDDFSDISEKYKVTLFDEVLSYSYECGDEKKKLSPVIDTIERRNFWPENKI